MSTSNNVAEFKSEENEAGDVDGVAGKRLLSS